MSLTAVKSGRDKALAAALQVLGSQGVSELTMRAIADAAGMTAPALYWHYQDKNALLRDVHRAVTAIYREHVYAVLADDGALTRLMAVLEAFRTFAVTEPHYHELLFLNQLGSTGSRRPSSSIQILIDRVRDCMRQNELREGEVASIALTVHAHALGLVLLYRHHHFESEGAFGEFYRRSVERLLLGIAR
jgi:AcrR family transcriptional regulator